ncbi:YciI family protein [Cryptosporangium sp. NPDC048952]|uniref:YciI family protein n=1 Tax=Cryptosporangium sp. NPDC048952 TaxID=3363961 RepID=UPI0037244C5E
MKYLILMYGSQRDYDLMTTAGPDDFAPMHAFMEQFSKDLVESGEFVDTRGLDAPVHTRRVGQQNGVPVVTDGPYAETQEVLAGYWVVDCESFDRATQIAGRLASCPSPNDVFADGYCDVRPILDHAPEPEL